MLKRYPPDDPREWLNRANSSLAMARTEAEGIYLEDLCFQAQQAAEKAIKAILIKHRVEFPYIHDIARLLTLLESAGQDVPGFVREAERLTPFSTVNRYPGIAPPVRRQEYQELMAIAEKVVRWAEGIEAPRKPQNGD
jgi:HEPN domain-containing protein